MAHFQSTIANLWIERKGCGWVVGTRATVREGEVEQLKLFGCQKSPWKVWRVDECEIEREN
jgi:hypothetical protein